MNVPDWAAVTAVFAAAFVGYVFWLRREVERSKQRQIAAELMRRAIADIRRGYEPRLSELEPGDDWWKEHYAAEVAEQARQSSPFGPVRKWGWRP